MVPIVVDALRTLVASMAVAVAKVSLSVVEEVVVVSTSVAVVADTCSDPVGRFAVVAFPSSLAVASSADSWSDRSIGLPLVVLMN